METISAEDIVETIRSGLLVLDQKLSIVSANRAFYSIFKSMPEQVIGRRIYDIGNGQWDIPVLRQVLEDIIPSATTVENYEVEHDFPDIGKKIFVLNARKVHREGNHSELLLIAFEDVTLQRVNEREAERVWRLAQNIVDTVRDPMVILESDLTVITASRAFLNIFQVGLDDLIGRSIQQLGQGQWDVQALTTLLEKVVPSEAPINDFLLEDDFPGIGRRIFKINARKVYRPGNHVTRLLVVFEDATDATLFDRNRDMMAAELAHRVKNSLQVISSFVAYEIRRAAEPCINGYQAMQARINAVAQLYDVIARSSAFGPVSIQLYLEGIAKSISSSLLGTGNGIAMHVEAEPVWIHADLAVPIGLLINELATNAIKYAFPSGSGIITLGFRKREGEVVLTVSDDGAGMTPTNDGSGMGSRFVAAFVKQIGGTIATATAPTGTTFTIRLPSSTVVDTEGP